MALGKLSPDAIITSLRNIDQTERLMMNTQNWKNIFIDFILLLFNNISMQNRKITLFITIFLGIVFILPLHAQDYYTTIDWLNLVDVPSYLQAKNFRKMLPFYYFNQSTHITTTNEDITTEYENNSKAWFYIFCFNYDRQISNQCLLGILPVGTLGISPGGIGQKNLISWLKVKYFPFKEEDIFIRLATKLPLYQINDLRKQVDVDFSILLTKSFSVFKPEVLIGYRYRCKINKKIKLDNQEYGIPGNEFHYRVGYGLPIGENIRYCLFLLGYFSQDKKSYSYNSLWGEQTTVYKTPYKMSIGLTLSHFIKGKSLLGENTKLNITILKALRWQNDSGGWALVIDF